MWAWQSGSSGSFTNGFFSAQTFWEKTRVPAQIEICKLTCCSTCLSTHTHTSEKGGFRHPVEWTPSKPSQVCALPPQKSRETSDSCTYLGALCSTWLSSPQNIPLIQRRRSPEPCSSANKDQTVWQRHAGCLFTRKKRGLDLYVPLDRKLA